MSSIVGFVGSKNAVISSSGGTGALTRKGGSIDYEEGTWTATDNADGQLSDTLTYTKVGRVVTIHIDVTWTTSSHDTMKGLPFVCGPQHGGSSFPYTTNTGEDRSFLINANTTTGTIYNQRNAAKDPDEKRFIGSFTYLTV